MSSASDVTSHFADPANLKMVQQHMNNAANQDNRVERNTPLAHFSDGSNLKMVQLGNMGKLPFSLPNFASFEPTEKYFAFFYID